MTRTYQIPLALLSLASCGSSDPEAAAPAPSGPEPPAAASVRFVDATAASGVDFLHVAGAEGGWALSEIMGGGGALFDMDDDGDLDLLLLAGAVDSANLTSAPSGQGHALYENAGDGTFRDVSSSAGLDGLRGYAMGAATGDVNGDGKLDLYITQLGSDALLLGDGAGHFEDVTAAWNAATSGWSTSAAFVDMDADGDLDLFVARYIVLRAGLECHDSAGRRTYCPPASGPAVHDVFLRNDGATFTDVSKSIGLDAVPQPGLGVVCQDLTGDGAVDIYVANDGQANQLWTRQADGAWRDEATQRGVALNQNGLAEASMGVVAEDLDGDGMCDLFMTHLQEETHTLYGARRRGSFRDRTGAAGLTQSTRPVTGFGTCALDVDLDGDLDLAVANGRVRIGPVLDGCTLDGVWGQLAEPNMLLMNAGDGRFTMANTNALTAPVHVDRSVLSGDLDGDGDIDLVFTRNEGHALVLHNESERVGSWILVDPRQSSGGATALGTRVRAVVDGENASLERTVRSSDGYQSSRDPRVHVALPSRPKAVDLSVRWPDGTREVFPGRSTETQHRVIRGEGESR